MKRTLIKCSHYEIEYDVAKEHCPYRKTPKKGTEKYRIVDVQEPTETKEDKEVQREICRLQTELATLRGEKETRGRASA